MTFRACQLITIHFSKVNFYGECMKENAHQKRKRTLHNNKIFFLYLDFAESGKVEKKINTERK